MKKILLLLLAVALLTSVAFAATVTQYNTADAMNELGLFQGTNKGYELDNGLTRAQGTTLLVRMIGKEAEANANKNTYVTPFTDVDTWAAGYVGYAYTNGITNGISATAFGSNQPMTDYMFLTLTLRALGYSDSGENALYTWNNPYSLAYDLDLVKSAAADSAFTRADAVDVFWNALDVKINGTETTLADRLISQGIFTAEELAAARQTQENGRKDPIKDPIQDPIKDPIQEELPEIPDIPVLPQTPSNPTPGNNSGNNSNNNSGNNSNGSSTPPPITGENETPIA